MLDIPSDWKVEDGGMTDQLELLFRAVLQYRSPGQDAVISAEDREGVIIGSGDGTVTGALLEGSLRWSLWARDCVYPAIRDGAIIPDGLHLCTMDAGGLIETPDGATISFSGRGYGLRSPDKYRTSLTLAFATDHTSYAWLQPLPGLMSGEFDETSGRAMWNVYLACDLRPGERESRSHAH